MQRERECRPLRARCLPTENARFGRRVRSEEHRHSPAREHRTAQTRSHARARSSSAVAAFSSRPRWNGSRARVPHPGKGLNPYSHRNCWNRHDGDPGARRQAKKMGRANCSPTAETGGPIPSERAARRYLFCTVRASRIAGQGCSSSPVVEDDTHTQVEQDCFKTAQLSTLEKRGRSTHRY